MINILGEIIDAREEIKEKAGEDTEFLRKLCSDLQSDRDVQDSATTRVPTLQGRYCTNTKVTFSSYTMV